MRPEILPNSQSARAREVLACPKCKGALRWNGDAATCASCGLDLPFVQGVAIAMDTHHHSNFDTVYEIMREANKEKSTWEMFYRQQTTLISDVIRGGGVVVDVGCGPELPYDKGSAFVVGVDASFASVRANAGVDLRIFGSASELPLQGASADVVLCLYAIHHMTGKNVPSNEKAVRMAFREFARILKPEGRLLVFEASPYAPFALAQRLAWGTAKRVLGEAFDMHFWTASQLERMGMETLGSPVSQREFQAPWLQTFPPIFSKPSFRVPRVAYPFHIRLYEWRMPAGRAQ